MGLFHLPVLEVLPVLDDGLAFSIIKRLMMYLMKK